MVATACIGSSLIDGNAAGGAGYLCRDQIGAGQDAFLWNFTQPAPPQAKVPVYIWETRELTTEATASDIKLCRDCHRM